MTFWPRHDHSAGGAVIPDGEWTTGGDLGGVMWAHILIMGLAFGIVFPVGLVCGLAKSRWHVPVQTFGSALTLVGFFLGHAHSGRMYHEGNIHSVFAPWVLVLLLGQIAMGVVLRLHLNRGILGRIRPILARVHLTVAILFPIVSWVQMGFGSITMTGFCHRDHLGQCLAHGIMGSSFILYGFVLLLMLFVGEKWLDRRNRSQEFFDSTVITLWGIINTFTEHRWGQPWSHGDYQHTSMGVIWWAAGMVGMYLSWDRVLKQPRRNHIPAVVMIFTGYAMSQHTQHLMVSTKVHAFFGYMLMGAGLARIVEISFVLHDQPHRGPFIHSWQWLPPMLLIESGILFMAAQEEQLQWLDAVGIMDVSYVLVMSSVAMVIFLVFVFMLNLYVTLADANTKPGLTQSDATMTESSHHDIEMRPFLGAISEGRRGWTGGPGEPEAEQFEQFDLAGDGLSDTDEESVPKTREPISAL